MKANVTTKLVPVTTADKIEGLVKKLNRRAVRNGFDLIEFSKGNSGVLFFQEVISSDSVERTLITKEVYNKIKDSGTSSVKAIVVDAVEVTMTEEVSHTHDGYRLVGCSIKEDDGVALVHNFEDDKFDFNHLRGTCKCDHCGYDRERNSVYFVADKKDEITLLGSTCVQLFFPNVQNPLEKFDFTYEFNKIFVEFGEEEFWGKSVKGNAYTVSVEESISLALYFSEKNGWTSQTKANDDERLCSTKDRVLGYLMDLNNPQGRDSDFKVIEQSTLKQYESKVSEIITFAESKKGENSFFDNANEYISVGFVGYKNMGYVVGILGWYNADQKKRVQESLNAENNSSTHLSEIGAKKVPMTGIVKSISSFESQYGIGHITTLITDCGNVVKYWNEFKVRGKDIYADSNDRVTFLTTIKDHKEFRGVKETIITRPSQIAIEKVG